MRSPVVLLALLACAMLALPAAAQTRAENLEACKGGEPEKAIAACTALIASGREKSSSLFEAHFNRGLAYAETRRHRRAIEDYDVALKLRRNDAAVLQSRCWSRSVTGRLSQAVEDCNTSLAIRPNDPDTLEIRGFTLRKMRRFEESIADYDAALALRPEAPHSLFGRGITRRDMGREDSARADIAAAKALDPDVAARYVAVGIHR